MVGLTVFVSVLLGKSRLVGCTVFVRALLRENDLRLVGLSVFVCVLIRKTVFGLSTVYFRVLLIPTQPALNLLRHIFQYLLYNRNQLKTVQAIRKTQPDQTVVVETVDTCTNLTEHNLNV